jgi:hypothetical protein
MCQEKQPKMRTPDSFPAATIALDGDTTTRSQPPIGRIKKRVVQNKQEEKRLSRS